MRCHCSRWPDLARLLLRVVLLRSFSHNNTTVSSQVFPLDDVNTQWEFSLYTCFALENMYICWGKHGKTPILTIILTMALPSYKLVCLTIWWERILLFDRRVKRNESILLKSWPVSSKENTQFYTLYKSTNKSVVDTSSIIEYIMQPLISFYS